MTLPRALVLVVLKIYIVIFSTTKYKFMVTLVESKPNNLAPQLLVVLKIYIVIFSTTKYKFMVTLVESKPNNLAPQLQCIASNFIIIIIKLRVHIALY